MIWPKASDWSTPRNGVEAVEEVAAADATVARRSVSIVVRVFMAKDRAAAVPVAVLTAGTHTRAWSRRLAAAIASTACDGPIVPP